MDLETRATIHSALGDPGRLAMVDALRVGDRTFLELAEIARLPGNLAAHHLDVLETAGLIERRISEGDHRRRYIALRPGLLHGLAGSVSPLPRTMLFVCTHNSARSQFAAARWRQVTNLEVECAGTEPAARVHPMAVRVATEYGLDLRDAAPKGYDAVDRSPDLVISVCDRAHEAAAPFDAPQAHWSIPDPVAVGDIGAFRTAFSAIATRINELAGPAGATVSRP
jgi:protein-tyrosine-phosphatase/DNA-binding transcriptional ArsR family regulator